MQRQTRRAAARHWLKVVILNEEKKLLKKRGCIFFLIPTTMQDKKPVYIKYFASELKITCKGKKRHHHTKAAQSQLYDCAMPTPHQQSISSVLARSSW